jgi:hypothetical protein
MDVSVEGSLPAEINSFDYLIDKFGQNFVKYDPELDEAYLKSPEGYLLRDENGFLIIRYSPYCHFFLP